MTTPHRNPPAPWSLSARIIVTLLLAAWFAAAAAAGMAGTFAAGAEQLARPVLLTILAPMALFLGAYAGSEDFRRFILSRDIRLATMLQSWRIIGFAFLALYAYDVLPGLFAWPAGLGDMAMGLSAPLVAWALLRRAEFATSRGFIVWNLLGLLDFAAAAVTSTLASGAVAGLVTGPVTAAPMEVWPLILFPAFIVPLFMMLHLTVLLQVWPRRQANSLAPAAGD